MLSKYCVICVFLFACVCGGGIAYAAESVPFEVALNNVRVACSGIGDSMADMKRMAGINVAVTGVGTAAGIGATVTGLVKTSKDKQSEVIEVKLDKLRQIEEAGKLAQTSDAEMEAFIQDFESNPESIMAEIEQQQRDLDKLNKQSKNLGNWRTGLMAGSAATNVAGAIIAGTNKTDQDLKTRINNCVDAIADLEFAIGQARIDGRDVSHANDIVSACREYKYVNLKPIDDMAKGAMIASTTGAATGLAGTITSAIANTDSTRNDNSDAGKKKEKNLNNASNILAGATTVASATATVFNAKQISAIKQVAAIADNCEQEINK